MISDPKSDPTAKPLPQPAVPVKRDGWDKFEIICKGLGALLVPVAVAVVGYMWNDQATKRQAAAHDQASARQMASQMTSVAVGILQAAPKSQVGDKELRTWAVAVLQSPQSPPPLTEKAAEMLELSGFPIGPYDLTFEDLRRLEAIANRYSDLSEAPARQVEGPPIIPPGYNPEN